MLEHEEEEAREFQALHDSFEKKEFGELETFSLQVAKLIALKSIDMKICHFFREIIALITKTTMDQPDYFSLWTIYGFPKISIFFLNLLGILGSL